MKTLSFVLLAIGTLGLLIIEFTEGPRYLTLTFAASNVLGFVILALSQKGVRNFLGNK